MIILEVVLNGIRNFSTWLKIPLKPSLNFIQGPNGSGKTSIATAIASLLSPEDRQDLIGPLLPEGKNNPAQGALAFKAKDGKIYRIARDFRKEISNLFVLDSNRKFTLLEKDRSAIREFMLKTIGGTDGRTPLSLFWLSMDEMPSSVLARFVEPSSPDAATRTPHPFVSPVNRNQIERRLAELRASAGESDRIITLEQQISDVHASASDLKRRITSASTLQSEIAQEKEKLDALRGFESVPRDIDIWLDTYETALKRKTDRLNELEDSYDALQEERDHASEEPIWSNPVFIGGCVGLISSFVAGLFINLVGIYQQIYLAALFLSIGAVVYSVIRDLRLGAKRRDLDNRIAAMEKEHVEIDEQFNQEHLRILELFQKTDSPDTSVFRERLRQYEFQLSQYKGLNNEYERLMSGKNRAILDEELETLHKEIAEKEEALRNFTGSMTDAYSIQEEIRRLEAELSGNSLSQADSVLDIPDDEGPFRTAKPPWPGVTAARAVLTDHRDQLKAFAMEAFHKFGIGNGIDITVTPEFEPELTPPHQISRLSPGMMDQVQLAFILGCLKAWPLESGLPVIWDDPLLRLDNRRRTIALDLLRDVSQGRQILFFTGMADSPRPGESVFLLP